MIWDNVSYTSDHSVIAPVSQTLMSKLTITYPDKDSYTPGDAYDIYFDESYIIREWSYRKANAKEPNISNTFENYQDYKGLKIAQEHKKAEGDWSLLLRNIKVELQE